MSAEFATALTKIFEYTQTSAYVHVLIRRFDLYILFIRSPILCEKVKSSLLFPVCICMCVCVVCVLVRGSESVPEMSIQT